MSMNERLEKLLKREQELVDEIFNFEFIPPPLSRPIKADVLTFDWSSLDKFDVITLDPPWMISSTHPSRGVAIGYKTITDEQIANLPIEDLQANGLIFLWVINNKFKFGFDLLEKWGYDYVDDITWVKKTINRRVAKGHGYYLQHAKETCLVGMKGDLDPLLFKREIGSDVIFSERRGQSQKPEEIYHLIEEIAPGGKYLEIFGRRNNLRNHWVTVGNEL